jgi:hypothetical protein
MIEFGCFSYNVITFYYSAKPIQTEQHGYHTLKLEQHPNFTLVTGTRLPIGASLQVPGVE